MTKQNIENYAKTKLMGDLDDCDKCGNPIEMYWCCSCESNQESDGKCEDCGFNVCLDEDYHNNCN